MANSIYWAVIWTVLSAAIFFGALRAGRSRRAMYVGRIALGIL
jgi:hypothetical protein